MRLRRFLIPFARRNPGRYFSISLQHRTMSGRSYRDAIDLLNTLQSNAATLEAAKASGGQSNIPR